MTSDETMDDQQTEAELNRQIAAFEMACHRYALTVDSLARAAAEGYGIVGGVMSHVVAALVPADDPGRLLATLVEHHGAWGRWSWEERDAPGPQAFRVRDLVAKHVATVRLPDGAKVTVDRIMRAHHILSGKRTVVVVWLEAPGQPDRALLFDAE